MRLFILALALLGATALPAAAQDPIPARLVHARDGDSYVMEFFAQAGPVRSDVRLIGVDCPEYGTTGAEEAWTFARAWFQRFGNEALVQTDVKRFDRHHRLLGYVRAPWGERMLNIDIIRAGLCRARRYPPNTARQPELERAQAEADRERQ